MGGGREEGEQNGSSRSSRSQSSSKLQTVNYVWQNSAALALPPPLLPVSFFFRSVSYFYATAFGRKLTKNKQKKIEFSFAPLVVVADYFGNGHDGRVQVSVSSGRSVRL